MKPSCLLIVILFFLPLLSNAQADSTLQNLESLPTKYFTQLDSKIDKYSSRITRKTTKTLEKLARWETKIKSLLDKTSPETSAKLFGEGKMTFNKLLQQMQSGQQTMLQYQTYYDKYRDDLTTSLMYVEQQKEYVNEKVLAKAKRVKEKMHELNQLSDSTEAVQQFIKERKKELINTAFQYLGKNKYLSKINKEAWYYAETMRNYKEIFNDEKKMEQTAKMILNKIPAFQQFMNSNSFLSKLFPNPNYNSGGTPDLSGLQTRSSVTAILQERISAGGPNAMGQITENMQMAQGELDKFKEKLLNPLIGNGGGTLPDFKPNMQKTKTFLQRIEYGTNFQFAKSTSLLPTVADIALTVGFKLNDKSTVGVGLNYKMGLGTIQHIRLSHQGIGLRSFIDYKLKKQFFVTGGYELNHNAGFSSVNQLKNYEAWQRAALLGITKKLGFKSKWTKATNLQLLYDFLYAKHVPISQQVVFRIGYNF